MGTLVQKKLMKTKIDELTRLAFVWAEQDRQSLADCYPEGAKEKKKHRAEAKQLRDYRIKRWGYTKLDRIMGDIP